MLVSLGLGKLLLQLKLFFIYFIYRYEMCYQAIN